MEVTYDFHQFLLAGFDRNKKGSDGVKTHTVGILWRREVNDARKTQ